MPRSSLPLPAHHPWCAIIPPYVLEALSQSGDPEVEQRARATLQHDEAMRADRRTDPSVRIGEPTLTAVEQHAAAPRSTEAPSRAIHDCATSRTLPGTLVRAEGEKPTKDAAANEAYDGLGDTWTLFKEAFDRNSLDDRGLAMVASVHYGTGYDNAFWNGSQMVFGDGDGEIFLGFTRSIDVIGHELAHGVTQYTAGLNYEGQSGALNESISDVFGSLVKQHAADQSAAAADWLIGADLLAPGVKGRALRDMHHPGTAYDDPRLGKDPQPAHMDDFVETTADNGGVHINSGIPNRAFVLAALELGGNAWESVGQVWYDVLTGDIKADCDFATFAALTIAAAKAVDAETHTAVSNAWQGVGVDPAKARAPRARKRPTRTGAPNKNAKVVVRRTGGLAGQVLQREVLLRELPTEDCEQWQALVATRALERASLEQTRTHPDAFTYEVDVPSRGVQVAIPEVGLSDDQRTLMDRTLLPPRE